jgi:predicted esterase
MLPAQPPIMVPAAREPCRSALIMLHGRGDSGRGWADIAQMLGPHLPHTRFIFPTAPVVRQEISLEI